MRSYANRTMGHINHQDAMRRGVYSCYSMAYSLSRIVAQIGWQPFTDTFISFHEMLWWEVPQTDLEKLNVFLSLLRYHSGGRDVIAMMPQYAIPIYESFFGGRIQYVEAFIPNTIHFPQEGDVLALASFYALWTSFWGMPHYISLFNVNTRVMVIPETNIGIRTTTRYGTRLIEVSHLTAGHRYRLTVVTISQGQRNYEHVYFYIGAFTRIEIDQPNGLNLNVNRGRDLTATARPLPPIPAVVRTPRFVWESSNTNVATIDRYSGRITARNIAGHTNITVRSASQPSLSHTIRVNVRSGSPGAIANPPGGLITRGQPWEYHIMNIGWPLGNQFVAHRGNFNRISSQFGPRVTANLHLGMDIQNQGGGDATHGLPVFAVVDGIVERSTSDGDRGQHIAIKATNHNNIDPVTELPLIFLYNHLDRRLVNDGDTVYRGQKIGYAGRTGNVAGSRGHLHFEVSNFSNPIGPGSPGTATFREDSIVRRVNPRFFYSPNVFVARENGLVDPDGNYITMRIWDERNFNIPQVRQ